MKKEYIKNLYTCRLKIGKTTYIYVAELRLQRGLIPPPAMRFYYGPPTDCWAIFDYSGDDQAGIAKRYGMTQQAVSRAIQRGESFPYYKHFDYRFKEWEIERSRMLKEHQP